MRSKISIIVTIIALAALGGSLAIATPAAAKNVNNFYFESFDADYYVTKSDDGISHLKVVETLTAVFPDYNQNLGIERYIPYTNQNGANTTMKNAKGNVTVARNGHPEPIYNIEKTDGFFIVGTGDDTHYLHGRQVFTFTYTFDKVITDFNDYQELYWDTNGNGWRQEFGSLTARVHFEDPSIITATSCYVGKYGKSDPGRCEVTQIDDGYSFTTSGLKAFENLTFVTTLAPGVFSTPVDRNYLGVILIAASSIFCALTFYLAIKKYHATLPKRRFYKDLFVVPQYQPPKHLTVAEAAENSLVSTQDSRVASILQLAVSGNITLIRGKKRLGGNYDWSIRVNHLDKISKEQRIILQILNNGDDPAPGNTFSLKTTATPGSLESLGQQYHKTIVAALKRKSYLEDLPKDRSAAQIASYITGIFAFALFVIIIALYGEGTGHGVLVGGMALCFLAAALFFTGLIVPLIIKGRAERWAMRSEKSLTACRYTEGLKLYMKMAEKDRIAFLQSVEGADTSSAGIVRLYEKLLPYAVIFGLESSWLKQLDRALAATDATLGWYSAGDDFRLHGLYLHQFTHAVNTNYSRATTIMRTSGGSSSSGFSGSFGGGFSGGGGGGGGGGGR